MTSLLVILWLSSTKKATNSRQKYGQSLVDSKHDCLLSNKLGNAHVTVTNTRTRTGGNQGMKSTGTQKLSDWSTHSDAVCFALALESCVHLLLGHMVFWEPSLYYDRCQILLLFRIWEVVLKSSILRDITPCNMLKLADVSAEHTVSNFSVEE
jgi:hypothetical protein